MNSGSPPVELLPLPEPLPLPLLVASSVALSVAVAVLLSPVDTDPPMLDPSLCPLGSVDVDPLLPVGDVPPSDIVPADIVLAFEALLVSPAPAVPSSLQPTNTIAIQANRRRTMRAAYQLVRGPPNCASTCAWKCVSACS